MLLNLAIMLQLVAVTLQLRTCDDGRFRCVSDGSCLDADMICDDYPDCEDGEDETLEYANCGRRRSCPVRNQDMAMRLENRSCKKSCTRDRDCRGQRKRCICDGICGKSCFNPELRCFEPPDIANIRSKKVYRVIQHSFVEQTSNYKYGDFVQYYCNSGYIAEGPDRFCGSTRRWTGRSNFCARLCTSNPAVVARYDLSCGTDCRRDSDCRFPQTCECDGPCGRKCTNKSVDCGGAAMALNARLEYTGEGTDQVAHYICNDGYFMAGGQSSHLCSGSGSWYGDLIECQEVLCGNPQSSIEASGGEMITEASPPFSFNDTVHFRCRGNKILYGSESRTCMTNGQWSGNLAVCQERSNRGARCPNPGTPINGHRSWSDFQEGRTIQFSCDPDYALQGEAEQVCLWMLEWSGEGTPVCVDPRYRHIPSGALQKFSMSVLNTPPKRRSQTLARYISKDYSFGHDVYFVFDASRSISNDHFANAVAFAKNLIRRLRTYEHGVRYGIVAYAIDVVNKLNPNELDSQRTVNQTIAILDDLLKDKKSGDLSKKIKDGTATAKVLKEIRKMMSFSRISNANSRRMYHLFMFTDGKHNEGTDPIKERIMMTQEFGDKLEIYSITSCGECSNPKDKKINKNAYQELSALATSKENFIFIQDFYALNSYVDKITNFTINFNKCGQAHDVGSIKQRARFSLGRTTHGENANDRAWPWQAVLFPIIGNDIVSIKNLKGGGSLINKYWVMTAAHVIKGFEYDGYNVSEDALIALGLFRRPTKRSQLVGSVTFYRPKRVLIHPLYNNENFDYDIALIRIGKNVKLRNGEFHDDTSNDALHGEVKLSPYIRPVCLPCTGTCVPTSALKAENGDDLLSGNESPKEKCRIEGEWILDRKRDSSRSKAVITGFGNIGNWTKWMSPNRKNPKIPIDSQQGLVRILPNNTCEDRIITINNKLDRTGERHSVHTYTPRMFCVKSGEDDRYTSSCSGDSGGPLVREFVNHTSGETCWVQIGIVSWGYGCGAHEDGIQYPGYYTDISSVYLWIKNAIEREDGTQ